ncbi:hypothetical protein [Sphingomonas sp.]|jgi:hypothetical protein|uniref:beta strand repeat-containing protein n=1 Tax=Sphingomonas sp. TaxID=28214 RepID=UPI002D7F9A7C|nr:hypothetical protein [Sphingomonas sp.]HEU0045249.1 hypothetical protein [Sphingomonas sp.]
MNRSFARIASASLLGGASLLTLASAANAQTVIFSSTDSVPTGPIEPGTEVSVSGGTVQVRLPGGSVASFVDAAQFSIRTEGGVDLRSGEVTVVTPDGAEAQVHLPEGVRGTVARSSAASFSATPTGTRGSTRMGSVSILGNGTTKSFAVGQFWAAARGQAPDRVIADAAAAVPTTGPVRPLRTGGIVAAAENGIPVALGEALAGVGARGDVVAAARRLQAYDRNPTIAAFPSGDYALLVGYAAQAVSPAGDGVAFNGASADIIRTYFQYLAAGNSGPNFRTAYAGLLLNYLDLLRTGALPSTFGGATQAQLNAYLAFIGRTDGFGSLSATNRQLLDAYLAFLSTGGSADAFGGSVTSLTAAFLNFIRAGGQPAAFTQASASVVAQYLAIIQSGGLRSSLSAQNQALLSAYLAANGIGFVQSDATALAAFVAYLNAGGLPSGYTALPVATIRAYLERLETTGLFDAALGGQATFLRSYLVFLRGGGTADQFNALPINVARVNASALQLYVDYLLAGGAPSAYTALTAAQIRAYLDQMSAIGQFDALLGANAAFLSEYYAYLKTGADADTFAGLPTVDVQAYASALQLFASYLRSGNLPTGYSALTAQQIRSYLTALQVSGRLALLGDSAGLLAEYLVYIRGGGAPDAFAGLPIFTYQTYATSLATYFAYLNRGGLPSGYTALTQAQIREYLSVLQSSGQLGVLLGSNAGFFSSYLAYLAGGGAPDAFTSLPIVTFTGYASALNAYYAFLRAGGLPANYTALTPEQIRAYLDALQAAGQFTALLGADATFFAGYLQYLASGGSPGDFPGLPAASYASYGTSLANFIAYLRGNGLPGGYTALTAAQLREYLALLAANGQLSLIGDQADIDLVNAYAAYLAGGGLPDRFAGLPAFVTYESALRLYFAFIQGGGRPSGYTALTQAQIVAYVQALDAAGLVASRLSAAEASFLRDYAAYVAAGNNADQYAGLPANQPRAPVVTQGLANAPRANPVVTAMSGKNLFSAATTAGSINIDGNNISSIGGTRGVTNQTAKTVEARAVDNTVAIARWTEGTFNTDSANNQVGPQQGVHMVWGTPAANVPTTGSATFGMVAATSPTRDGGGVDAGSFAGNLGVDFASKRVGWDSVISLGGVNYRFASDGGITAPSVTISGTNTFNGQASTANNGLAGSGTGFLAGAGGSLIGFAYMAQGPGVNGEIEGTAIFGRYAPATTLPAVTPPNTQPSLGYGYTAGLPGSNLRLLGTLPTANNQLVQQIGEGVSATPAADGTLTTISGPGGSSTYLPIARTSARSFDVAGNARGVVGRWSDGAISPTELGAANLLANQGYHYALMAPLAFTVPTTGRVDYVLAAATRPTFGSGATLPGVFDAKMSILFRAAPLVGLQGTIVMPETGGATTYSFATPGGTANPSAATQGDFSRGYFQVAAPMTGTGMGCSSECSLVLQGTLGGADPLAVGAIYRTFGSRSGTGEYIAGAALFTGTAVAPAPAGQRVVFVSAPRSNVANDAAVVLNAAGAIQSFTSTTPAGTEAGAIGTASAPESGSVANIVSWTRWANGSPNGFSQIGPNEGVHVVAGVTATALPTSGTVNYALIGSTKPTDEIQRGAPGTISGSAAVAFGTTPRVGLDLNIGVSGKVWRLATAGGVATPSSSELTVSTVTMGFSAGAVGLSGVSGGACSGFCSAFVQGGLYGPGASNIGLTYIIDQGSGSGRNYVTGSAVFGNPVPASAGSTAPGQFTYAYAGGSLVEFANGATTYQGTTLKSYVASGGQTRTGFAIEGGRLADTIGWSRWGGDTAGPLTNQGPNQGVHLMSGTPTTVASLPNSGTVQYTLAGGTKTTLGNGGAPPGTLTGTLGVQFGSLPRVGFDLTASVGDYGWRVQTTGGSANPGQSQVTVGSQLNFSGQFGKTTGVSGTTAASCVTGCTATIGGQMYGSGASHIGLAFNMTDSGPAGVAQASAIGVFAKAVP